MTIHTSSDVVKPLLEARVESLKRTNGILMGRVAFLTADNELLQARINLALRLLDQCQEPGQRFDPAKMRAALSGTPYVEVNVAPVPYHPV